MSEAKFTPGPWFAGQTHYQKHSHPGQRCIGLALEDGGGVFGYRLHPNNDDGSYLNISGFCSEADGCLIAAAPDLYAAVANAEAYFATLPADDDAHPLYLEMNAALAKARGETA